MEFLFIGYAWTVQSDNKRIDRTDSCEKQIRLTYRTELSNNRKTSVPFTEENSSIKEYELHERNKEI